MSPISTIYESDNPRDVGRQRGHEAARNWKIGRMRAFQSMSDRVLLRGLDDAEPRIEMFDELFKDFSDVVDFN